MCFILIGSSARLSAGSVVQTLLGDTEEPVVSLVHLDLRWLVDSDVTRLKPWWTVSFSCSLIVHGVVTRDRWTRVCLGCGASVTRDGGESFSPPQLKL